jgi:anaphase-promoting complex subunit 2
MITSDPDAVETSYKVVEDPVKAEELAAAGDAETFGSPDEDDGGASAAEAQLEQEMTVYESYIVGMLTNLKQLPVDRIHNMLKVGCSLRARPAAAHASPHTCPLPALTPG